MNADSVLRFEFAPAQDAERRSDGWGQGRLFLSGRPYWFFNSEADPQPVDWTWVDFLEHIAEFWGSLVSEQAYPFEWLRESPHPGELWKVAERRWARMGDATADQEEPRLLAFERRHNLSAAWKGLGLPALTWLRVGETVWLCPEGDEPIRASYSHCRTALLLLGNELAAAYANSNNPRVAAAVRAWHTRGQVFQNHFVEWATGLSQDQLQQIQEGQVGSQYWEVAANSDWESGRVFEGELLAAARMTAGVLDTAHISRVVRVVRNLKKRRSDELDALTTAATAHVARKRSRFAFAAGYDAADFLKGVSVDAKKKFVDVSDLLGKLKVELVDVDLGTDKIDAIAVWGGRGPCIALNSSRSFVNSDKRTRMTLAHELCHLLIDRKNGLPFCEVLGGQVDDFIEKRANAFAAELLLPRASVEHEWTLWRGNFSDFLALLSQDYGVSKSVACAQIYNCTVMAKLDRQAQAYVTGRLLDFEGRTNPTMVKAAEGVV